MAAQYYGSSNRGLGFYHIDVKPRGNRFSHWNGFDNFGVFTIVEGDIDEEGIVDNLRELFDKDWSWQLKKTDEDSYIIRFPPNKKVENLVIGKASQFQLSKPKVVASLSVWNGDAEPLGKLTELWVQIKGIPPKWVDWDTVGEVSSSIGLMVDLDWHTLFNSFFSMVRVKVMCKNPSKVPRERVYVFQGGMYLISFKTEGFDQVENSTDGDSGLDGGVEELEDDDLLDDDPLEEPKEKGDNPKKEDGPNSENGSKIKSPTAPAHGGKKVTVGNRSVRRELCFEDENCLNQKEAWDCATLLKAMELGEGESEGEDLDGGSVINCKEDDEQLNLPEEWIYDVQQKQLVNQSKVAVVEEDADVVMGSKELELAHPILTSSIEGSEDPLLGSQPSPEQLRKQNLKKTGGDLKLNGKRSQKGPVLQVRRSSRHANNDKPMLTMAQEIKRKWNLEDGKENRLEKYGNTSLQDSWTAGKLDHPLPWGHEGSPHKLDEESQGGGCQDMVAPFSAGGKCLKVHRGEMYGLKTGGGARRIQKPFQIVGEDRSTSAAADNISEDDSVKRSILSSPLVEFSTVYSATNNFSEKLGEGGFGPVFKGILPDGQEIAIKRLSKSSSQGLEEFKNEVTVLSKLQHRNLVRLFGCCIHGEEKMMLYEYMPNKSLDSFIFNESKRLVFGWKLRYKIIQGIGRGLLYLHQDSRLKIIHRDLKASNILLDDDFNPKISDFGMARIFGEHQLQDLTRRIVGTYGYISPEYAMEGKFSEKSDVFSFGVLVLEIVSGRRNRSFVDDEWSMNLLGYAWTLWKEGSVSELIDPLMGTTYTYDEVCRCVQVGLLCVQELPAERPTMSLVLRMLSGDVRIPSPKQAAFFVGRASSLPADDNYTGSGNQLTYTELQGR